MSQVSFVDKMAGLFEARSKAKPKAAWNEMTRAVKEITL